MQNLKWIWISAFLIFFLIPAKGKIENEDWAAINDDFFLFRTWFLKLFPTEEITELWTSSAVLLKRLAHSSSWSGCVWNTGKEVMRKEIHTVTYAVVFWCLMVCSYLYTWCCMLTYFEITDSNFSYIGYLCYRINCGLCFC